MNLSQPVSVNAVPQIAFLAAIADGK